LINAKKEIESLFANGRGITREKQATLEGIVESGGDAFVVVEKPAPEGNWPCTKSGYAEVRKGSATQNSPCFLAGKTIEAWRQQIQQDRAMLGDALLAIMLCCAGRMEESTDISPAEVVWTLLTSANKIRFDRKARAEGGPWHQPVASGAGKVCDAAGLALFSFAEELCTRQSSNYFSTGASHEDSDLSLLLSLTHPKCIEAVRENSSKALQLGVSRMFNQNDPRTEKQYTEAMYYLMNRCNGGEGYIANEIARVLLKLGERLRNIPFSLKEHKCREIIAADVMYFLLLARVCHPKLDASPLCDMYKEWNIEHPSTVTPLYWLNRVNGDDGDGLQRELERRQEGRRARKGQELPKHGTYLPQPTTASPQPTTASPQPTTAVCSPPPPVVAEVDVSVKDSDQAKRNSPLFVFLSCSLTLCWLDRGDSGRASTPCSLSWVFPRRRAAATKRCRAWKMLALRRAFSMLCVVL